MSNTTRRPHYARTKTRSRSVVSSEAKQADCEIAQAVHEKLCDTGYGQLRRLDVAVESGRVRVSGKVRRYYLRQLAQTAVMKTDGVLEFSSEIEVVES